MNSILILILMFVGFSVKADPCQNQTQQLKLNTESIQEFIENHTEYPWVEYDYNGYKTTRKAIVNFKKQKRNPNVDPNLIRLDNP